MPKYANCVIEPDRHPLCQAPDGSREVTPLITGEICGAESCSAGLWWLHPGQECTPDIHPDADELYYVVSGEGITVVERHALPQFEHILGAICRDFPAFGKIAAGNKVRVDMGQTAEHVGRDLEQQHHIDLGWVQSRQFRRAGPSTTQSAARMAGCFYPSGCQNSR